MGVVDDEQRRAAPADRFEDQPRRFAEVPVVEVVDHADEGPEGAAPTRFGAADPEDVASVPCPGFRRFPRQAGLPDTAVTGDQRSGERPRPEGGTHTPELRTAPH